jgi:hypothetical protein
MAKFMVKIGRLSNNLSERKGERTIKNIRMHLWLARFLIGVVFFFNLQCAMVFIVQPEAYTAGFELTGTAGDGMLRGMGLLFLMWNVPYAVALSHPRRQRISLLEAVAMQAIGFFGETLLLLGLPAGHPALVDTVGRFILFDGVGLALLVTALWLVGNPRPAGVAGA